MIRPCAKCGHANHAAVGGPAEACPRCGAIYAKVAALAQGGAVIRNVAPVTPEDRAAALQRSQDAIDAARRTGKWGGFAPDILKAEAGRVVVTTTDFVPGHRVAAIRDVVVAERAHAFGALYEEFAGLLRNVVGSGKSTATARLLQDSRAGVLSDLREKALGYGANAVIDLRFDYEEFSGANGHGVVVVVGTGTAVWVDPAEGAGA